MTNSPKILPWIARKTGLSDSRVEALWRKAAAYAAHGNRRVGHPEFYRAAMEHLHVLVMREKTIGA